MIAIYIIAFIVAFIGIGIFAQALQKLRDQDPDKDEF